MSALLPEIPALEYRGDIVGDVIDGERAAVEKQHDYGLAGSEHGAHEFVLAAHHVEAGAVAEVLGRPGLARGLLVAADGEHDDVGAARDLDGFGDLLAVFRGVA